MTDKDKSADQEKALWSQKIFPRNLTARAAHLVAGNPVTTRLESGVGNCYPGLEYDHRNLDRRFFPGLIFDFVSQDDADAPNRTRRGIRLTALDLADLELRKAQAQELAATLRGTQGVALSSGNWFIDEIEQGGVVLRTYELNAEGDRVPMDGMIVYHFVRGLEVEKEVRIKLTKRLADGEANSSGQVSEVVLDGWRRRYLNEDGVISEAYEVGELTQSLCSPWMHDFRDCGCNYWASNHPDIVLAEDYLGEALLPTGAAADAFRSMNPVDWLRADRNREASAEAFPTRQENRPYQMDHYEINRRWEQLAIVLGGKEISQIYRLNEAESANPLPTPEDVAERLIYLATLEHVLILEYLYAYFSIAPENKVDRQRFPEIDKAVIFARHELLLIAISEMRHLRWANQLIWELEHAGLIPANTGPSLGVAKFVPAGLPDKMRPRQLRLLTPKVLDDFIAVEAPSGTLDGQYAEVAASLRLPLYPRAAYGLAERIIADGVEHFSRFREVKLVLSDYSPADPDAHPPYLLKLTPAAPDHPRASEALEAYSKIISNLETAYRRGDMEDANDIISARLHMVKLQEIATELAGEGLGIPFFAILPDGEL